MDPRAEQLANKRLRLLARICLFWGLIVLLRLVELQILDHDKYVRLAQGQQEREVPVQARRGTIFDRNGEPLAMSTPVESVCINPRSLPDPMLAAELLAKVLDLDPGQLLGRIVSALDRKSGFLWVKRRITDEEAVKLRRFGFEWIELRTESSRYYPKGQRAAHVLGGVDHEEKGNAGIEQYLDRDLTGTPGMVRTKADVRQTVYERVSETDAEPGKHITLTIDERVQYIAERELAEAVKAHYASTGSLVVMDPRNGQILAIANYPTYDPNVPPKRGEDVKNRRNLAVVAPFEPGSVFKVYTLAAALETTNLRPGSMFHCGNGQMTLFKRVIRDASAHGWLSAEDVLAKSSNIGAIKIALDMGKERFYDYLKKFAFGQKTGLPLPGESGGLVRRPERWIPSSIGSVAMGHEISTTNVQLARACSVIANGGFLVKPKLVISKQRPGGVVETEPDSPPQPVLKPDNAIKMRLMMERAVVHGTGWRAQLDGFATAGKTGSAQIYDFDARVYTHRYNGSFMGFAPVNDPKVVIVITLNGTRTGNSGFGGVVAAPVFRTVASAALRFMDAPRDPTIKAPPRLVAELGGDLAIAGISQPPERPEEEDQGMLTTSAPIAPVAMLGPAPPPGMESKGPRVPDFQGMTKRAVLEESFASGIRVEIAGSGIARSQDPPPGVALRTGERVRIRFAP